MATPSKETLRGYWRLPIAAEPELRAHYRALARRQGLSVAVYVGLLLRNHAARPFKLELLPAWRRDDA
ncbi:MAG TPA: hypothetical protein VFD73_01350 [Gemmatimonadales bacterium]|nr:hypothetical protein [Gemmatimonadales bacterium]